MGIFDDIVLTEVYRPLMVFSQQGTSAQMNDRKNYGLSFCLSGQITYVLDGRAYRSTPGHAVILPKGKTYTLLEDFRLFLSSEGIAVMGTYAVYSVLCFCLKAWLPNTKYLILDLLAMSYTLPIAPSSIMKMPVFLEYLVSLASFCAIYTFFMMWHRARIRKKWC